MKLFTRIKYELIIDRNMPETRHLENIVSPLTWKKIKPSNNSAVCDHLLHFKFLTSFGNFGISAYEKESIYWKLKKAF